MPWWVVGVVVCGGVVRFVRVVVKDHRWGGDGHSQKERREM